MAKSYLDYLKEVLKGREGEKEELIAQYETEYEGKKDKKRKEYVEKIKEKDQAYLDEIDKENVERLIEERKFREAIGNMGLSDSGLKSGISDLKAKKLQNENKAQRKAMEDEMNLKLSEIDNEKNEEISNVVKKFDDEVHRSAEALYKASLKTSGRSNRSTVSLKQETEEPENSQKPNVMKLEELTQQNYINIGAAISTFPTRTEYLREKKINDKMPDYKTLIYRQAVALWRTHRITQAEFDYLMDYFDVEHSEYTGRLF